MGKAELLHPRAYKVVITAREILYKTTYYFSVLAVASISVFVLLATTLYVFGFDYRWLAWIFSVASQIVLPGFAVISGVCIVVLFVTTVMYFYRYTLGQMVGIILYFGLCAALLPKFDGLMKAILITGLIVGVMLIVLHIISKMPVPPITPEIKPGPKTHED